MDRPVIDRPASYLVDNGILFEMNRQVLHPLGLELHLEVGDDGSIAKFELLDNRASPEPIYFTNEEFADGRDKYEKYMQEHGRRNFQKRRQIGMVVQTGPNLPHHIHGREEDGSEE